MQFGRFMRVYRITHAKCVERHRNTHEPPKVSRRADNSGDLCQFLWRITRRACADYRDMHGPRECSGGETIRGSHAGFYKMKHAKCVQRHRNTHEPRKVSRRGDNSGGLCQFLWGITRRACADYRDPHEPPDGFPEGRQFGDLMRELIK